MMDPDAIKAFGDKSLGDVLQDIYDKSKDTSRTVNGLIDQLADLMENREHALVLVPLIKEYLEIDVKNDEKIVKIAQIVQRLATGIDMEGGGGVGELSDGEKSQLRELAKEVGRDKDRDLKDKARGAVREIQKEDEIEDV
jgi:hypothetical protein